MLRRCIADHPLRRPDWRYHEARGISKLPVGSVVDVEDPGVYELSLFHQRLGQLGPDKHKLQSEEPAQWLAAEIYHDPHPELRFLLEARILTGDEIEKIAASMGVAVEAVKYYIVNYFDVRSRLGRTDFIHGVVLRVDPRSTLAEQRGQLLKRLAYYGGSKALEMVLGRLDEGRSDRDDPLSAIQGFVESLLLERALQSSQSSAEPKALQQILQVPKGNSGDDASSLTKEQYEQHVAVFLENIPWRIHDDGNPDPPELEKWHHSSVEPRAEEWWALSQGGKVAEEAEKVLLATEARTRANRERGYEVGDGPVVPEEGSESS